MKSVEELISGCLRRDRASENALYQLCKSDLYKVCRRYARNKTDADDIFHDGFVRVFKSLEQYKGEGSFEGWMRRVFINVAIRWYQNSRFTFELNGYDVLPDYSVEPTIIDRMSAEALVGFINKLSDGYRMVFNMYLDGFSHKEIGDTLDIGESSSRSQLTKARKHLVKMVETELGVTSAPSKSTNHNPVSIPIQPQNLNLSGQ